MFKEFDNTHEINIKTIDAIIKSLNNYLSYMQTKHKWRDTENRSQAILEWKRKFIVCKEKLNSIYSDFYIKINTIVSVKNQSDILYSQIIADIKSLPNLVTNTNQTITFRGEFNSTSSNIDILRIWEKKYNTDINEIPRKIEAISKVIADYNSWLAEVEITQSMNYKAMGMLEKLLKDIFQDNNEARSLREHILNYSFKSLSINNLFFNTKTQIE